MQRESKWTCGLTEETAADIARLGLDNVDVYEMFEAALQRCGAPATALPR